MTYYSDITWAEILLLLTWMAQYFDVTILYTPTFMYSIDIEYGNGSFIKEIVEKRFEYKNNHIPYIKESHVSKVIKFDEYGRYRAIKYANNRGVSCDNRVAHS